MAKHKQPIPDDLVKLSAEMTDFATSWATVIVPMPPVRSPHVFHLLQNIAERTRETELALAALAVDTIKERASAYSIFETTQGPAFVLTRAEVRQFLVDAGVEEWGRATWLAIDPETKGLKADIRLNHGIRQSSTVLDEVAKTALMSLQIGKAVTMDSINGIDYFGFRAVALYQLLESAHAIVKSTPGWVDPPLPTQRPRHSF
ncbi:hypothetical protein ABIC83_002547 [Roseateles asaccharophilus]|uniref:hypothetical protein n=1 Tax=Roseateles asaccharophilus TaxID=582607 RepID=UPI003834189E